MQRTNDFISREAAILAMRGKTENQYEACGIRLVSTREATKRIRKCKAADVAQVVRCGKDRLTKLGTNGIYGLVKVKDNEQEVDSPYKNTLAAIVECFQRLAEYENAEFGTDGGEQYA